MPTRPDLGDRANWIRLWTASAPGPAEGSPPLTLHGPGDPSGPAWDWSMRCGHPTELAAVPGLRWSTEGPAPLTEEQDGLAIEVWTECELAVLHAAFRGWAAAAAAGVEQGSPWWDLGRRLAAAVAWHRERTQPDNATTRPWAIHAWLELGRPTDEAIDDAATMLHAVESAAINAGTAGPDPLSRWILADAARTFASLAGTRVGALGESVVDRAL